MSFMFDMIVYNCEILKKKPILTNIDSVRDQEVGSSEPKAHTSRTQNLHAPTSMIK